MLFYIYKKEKINKIMEVIKNENKTLTKDSPAEEVSEFLAINFQLTEENKICLIKENISGDVLPLLDNQDFKELKIKLGQKKKIQKFVEDNIDKLAINNIDIIIKDDSDQNEVKEFFENYLNFKDNEKIKDIDGKKLFSLEDQEMRNLGLTIGQRKKLIMYTEQVQKKLKENCIEILTQKSNAKEVAMFLKKKFNVSDKIIEEMALDGESLFLLSEADIDEIEDMPSETKNILKNFLNNKRREENSNITKKEAKKENEECNEIKIFNTPNGETNCGNIRNIDNNMTKQSIIDFDPKKDTKIKENNLINIKGKINNNENIIYENFKDINNKIKNSLNNENKHLIDDEKEDNNNKNNNNYNNLIEGNIHGDKNEKINPLLKEYEGLELDEIITYPINNYIIDPIIIDSKYNVFFFLIIKETSLENLKLSVYITRKKVQFKHYFIYDQQIKIKEENFKFILTQIPLKKDVKKLTILLEENGKEFKEKMEFDLLIDNYFYFGKIVYPDSFKKEISSENILSKYFEYFFDEQILKEIRYQKDFIFNLSNGDKFEMSGNLYFKFIKYCLFFNIKPKDINKIILVENGRDKRVYDEFIFSKLKKNFELQDNEKKQLFLFLIKNYSKYDNKFLYEIIHSKDINEYCYFLLNLLTNRKIEIRQIKFLDEEELFSFQEFLLGVSASFQEIKFIIKLSKNCTSSIKFIINNFKVICNILQKDQNFKMGWDNFLPFANLNDDDKIKDIFELIPDLMKINDTFEFKKVIDFEKLYESLINFYFSKSMNEFADLKIIIDALKSVNLIQGKDVDLFYRRLHHKGLNMIENKTMKIDEIIFFIYNQDIYYYDSKFKTSYLRDPTIFKHIGITEKDKNYLLNIEKLKENKIWELFKGSTEEMKKNFYYSFLDQITLITDFKNIFELFPIDSIDITFLNLISIDLTNSIRTILLVKEENFEIIFSVLINYFKCCEKYNIKKVNFEINKLDYNFASKFYFYLLDKNEEQLINRFKEEILIFFLEQNFNKLNDKIIVKIILLNPDSEFCLHFFNQMDIFILTENDFYMKEKNMNFDIFKLFFEKCQDLIDKKKIKNGKYLFKSIAIKNKLKDDLTKSNVKYELINNLIDDDNIFYNKILVIFDNDIENSTNVYNMLKENLNKCKNKLNIFEKIEDYYNTFFKISKKDIIEQIKINLEKEKHNTLDKILNLNENKFINCKDFNFNTAIKDVENLKYKNSLFFMAIYNEKNNNENSSQDEKGLFEESRDNFIKTITKIITQKETKEAFFDIPYINEILKVTREQIKNLKDEIDFISNEFRDLNMDEYINNELMYDLINFSNKEKIKNLIEGIYSFNNSFCKISKFKITEFNNELKNTLDKLNSKNISGENIKEANLILNQLNFNLEEETALMKFYNIFLGKEDSIEFIKVIKESNLEIRNLNEFIDESDNNSQLQMSDIDNLLDVYTFFKKFMENEEIETDEIFFNEFKAEFERDNNIGIKLQGYLTAYGEIYQLYQLYDENSEMTSQKIAKILNNSIVEIYKEKNEKGNFTYKIKYFSGKRRQIEIFSNEIDELKNKILISSNSKNINFLNEEGKNEEMNKEKFTKKFVDLIENIQQLNKFLNQLTETGYPYMNNLTLQIEDSEAFEKNNKNKNLKYIMESYNDTNNKYKETIIQGYQNYPLLRLFYGKNFIKLYERTRNQNIDISHLVNSMALNKIKNFSVNYKYDEEKNNIENINDFLNMLFMLNNCNLAHIYEQNRILKNLMIAPGLYKIEKKFKDSELNINIINLYFNLTGKAPIINTLLICNEETNIEEIKAFFFRAIFCEYNTLFVISNMESLQLSITQEIIKIINGLYSYRNRKINSVLIILYENENSGLSKDIRKMIPDKYDSISTYLKIPKNKINLFNDTEIYTSKFAGYGKTTEIINKVKERRGNYYYLPIGGTLSRNFVINNLQRLNIYLNNAAYLHIDLSETDNDNIMNEILLKLIILRYLNSNDKIYYLGNEVHIIIELPKGFIDFEEKYQILKLFKKTNINKLPPLRLEENAKLVKDSPISIVAETLELLDLNNLNNNIDLEMPIRKTAHECEILINKYFKATNQNYFQKMNFIKVLSIQFKKFHQCIYFDLSIVDPQRQDIILKARKLVLENFISLTKVFTQSPYDSILSEQIEALNKFGKYDDKKIMENAIASLAKNKKEVFSFQQIKPSLVFFNKDGQSLSIISNSNKNEEEYKNLQALWNSQNINMEEQKDLVDYKSLTHEGFLEQIITLFSLNGKTIDELKKFCESHGNYIFVSDNYIKMVRILLNIEAKIPVILMGETGVGKTKLLEVLSELYGNLTCVWRTLQIHAGITDQEIVEFIDKIIEEENKPENENKLIWVFFDEINTCNSLGLITEIMCNHTYQGKKINDNFIFIGACNPYRIITKKMKESGLVYYNMTEKNKLNNLVYTVNPLPHSLLNFVFDFGNLQEEDEKKYIRNTIKSMISKMENENLIDKNNKRNDEVIEAMINSIAICHNFIRELYDRSSVSMREIRRFGILFEYFMLYFQNREESAKKMSHSLNLTLYLCYYLRLNDKNNRKQLSERLAKFFNGNFIKLPETVVKSITQKMYIEKNTGIALNRALRENLFSIFICIINKIPLIIIGKPGTSKSLSFQILYNTMKGQYSENTFFKDKGKLYRYYYQGSETSTSKGIEQVFSKALKAQLKNKNKNIITLVFFDEMGLAERSSNNPLKVMHYLLEKDAENSVPFLGISNWRLDASKINRVLNLSITEYDIEDLEDTAISIAEALNNEVSNKYKEFFETLARVYNEYIILNQKGSVINKDFHGNRDFYNLIKNSARELIRAKEENKELEKNEKKVLTEIGIRCLEINFGGLEDSTQIIKELFKKEYGHKYYNNNILEKNSSIVEIIKSNILDSNRRYLMLVSDGNDASDIVKYILVTMKKVYIEMVGSKYKNDIKYGRYSEEILNKIKYIMSSDNILILRDLDMVYASLYDIFNQNFTIMGDKKFARIAFEYAKISSEINKDFRVIIIVNKEKIEELKLDPPFLNRFEKHIINFKMLLNERDIEISKKISEFFKEISGVKSKKLNINLEKLLVNCEEHDIDGLIFKIKNDKNLKFEDPQYEAIITEEIFKKVVPTFCQDIIVFLMTSKIKIEFQKMKDLLVDIYRKNRFYNFESFFENLQYNRNIIYTFSKITQDVYNDEKDLINKFGVFNSQSIEIQIIESIKSENDLIFLLKSFSSKEDKKILILKLSEKEYNQMNSINYVISNYEKENKILQNKMIIFTVHMQRKLKDEKPKKGKEIKPDFISFINNEYNQIFIDNLQGKEKYDIFGILSTKTNTLAKTFLLDSNFIDNKIYIILNYLQIKILNENKEFNEHNCNAIIAENIIKNNDLKEFILHNLEKQGAKIKEIINDVFSSKVLEINDVDFYEVVNSKFDNYFSEYLLKIIIDSLKQNILVPILDKNNLELLLKNEYLSNLVKNHFEKTTFNIFPKPLQQINFNRIVIYNGMNLPQSKQYLEKIIKYIKEEILDRYLYNEESLRERNININNPKDILEKYDNNLERIKENVKVEMYKEEFLYSIYNQDNEEFKELLLKDYLTYFIVKSFEKKEEDNNIQEKISNFLIIILKLKLKGDTSSLLQFDNSIDEMIDILTFTQGYFQDISILFDIFLDMKKYCQNLEDLIFQILNDNIIKYEISDRNDEYSKLVNFHWFSIIESMIRAILIFSMKIFENDRNKFHEYFRKFPALEAGLQKINKKYYLYSKEILNLGSIIKIHDSYRYNFASFENHYIDIVNMLLEQSLCLYNNEYGNYYQLTSELNKIFDDSFNEKANEYINLRFFIFLQEFKILSDEDTKIRLIEDFFKNPLLIKKSKILLFETLKDMKPIISKKEDDTFLEIKGNPILNKYNKLYEIYNNLNSLEFDEILLFTFENQCQSYFQEILNTNNGEYNKKSCKEILLENSLDKFIKAQQYLYENKENYDKLLKFASIAYIKTYIHFYVEINYHHNNLCDFGKINKVLDDENNQNKVVRNVRNIYLWRLYLKKFENFDQFQNFKYKSHKFPIFKELLDKLAEENNNNNNYIFNESFINQIKFDEFKKIQIEIYTNTKTFEFNFNEINQNFDILYCALVNKALSNLYNNNKGIYVEKLKKLYETTRKKIEFEPEGETLYQYLMNNEIFEKNIVEKISDNPLTQEEFEILLYSFRFVFNILSNKNDNFYKRIVKKNSARFINNNFIPGSFPFINEFIKSYNNLLEIFTKPIEAGYYICKDCGYLYDVPPCTLPMSEGRCPNGHVIGGRNHACSKMDIRVFPNVNSKNDYAGNTSFVSVTLEEYKKNYVDIYLTKKERGIIQGFRNMEFVGKKICTNLNNITFRTLNFILYSFILSAFVLNNITRNEITPYLVENLFPHTLFGIIKEGWRLLNESLKEVGIESSKIFFNMIFDKLIEFMINLDSCDTKEKMEAFEKRVNDFILAQIRKAREINQEYQKLNGELLNLNPNNIKEVIIGSYDPSHYSNETYPDIQYYCVSNINNLDSFAQIFNSTDENKKKYSLTNLLINKESQTTRNAINMKSLTNINKLSNLLIKIYSYKISREDAKKKKFKDEIPFIIKTFNEMNNSQITEKKFMEEYINPFIQSWEQIKLKAFQYKCRLLRDIERGEKPLTMKINNSLSYFLVDDGDIEGGMFLASAYEKFISWQNEIIDNIINNNKISGILNSYVSQLEREIEIQDTVESEIIKIDENVYDIFNYLISSCSIRNIFDINGKQIYYKNYNDIRYNFDLIEEELGKLILPGIKKFKKDYIKFITYYFEGFRGQNTSILVRYNQKYEQQELSELEKNFIKKLIRNINNDRKIYNDIFSSLQILMNEILKENYEQNYLIYDIIKNHLPKYVILNEELLKLISKKHSQSQNNKSFTVNSLVSIFEYFEDLCWEDIKKYIPLDFQETINDKDGRTIQKYFEHNRNNKKLINKNNLSNAVRKLISRYIVGTRQETDIKPESELKLFIIKDEFWSKNIREDDDTFNNEIFEIFKIKILVGQSFELFNLLGGDEYHLKMSVLNINDEIDNKNTQKKLNSDIFQSVVTMDYDSEIGDENKDKSKSQSKKGNKNNKNNNNNKNSKKKKDYTKAIKKNKEDKYVSTIISENSSENEIIDSKSNFDTDESKNEDDLTSIESKIESQIEVKRRCCRDQKCEIY